jgi:hypothetical protein
MFTSLGDESIENQSRDSAPPLPFNRDSSRVKFSTPKKDSSQLHMNKKTVEIYPDKEKRRFSTSQSEL